MDNMKDRMTDDKVKHYTEVCA